MSCQVCLYHSCRCDFDMHHFPYDVQECTLKLGSWTYDGSVVSVLLHKSHNAPVPYPTMHHFVKEMCTSVHISVTKSWCILGCLVHYGICEMSRVASWHENDLGITGPLWGESTGHRWVPFTQAQYNRNLMLHVLTLLGDSCWMTSLKIYHWSVSIASRVTSLVL